jgi:hypothetical protein
MDYKRKCWGPILVLIALLDVNLCDYRPGTRGASPNAPELALESRRRQCWDTSRAGAAEHYQGGDVSLANACCLSRSCPVPLALIKANDPIVAPALLFSASARSP